MQIDSNTRVLVTGASRGIGRATAQAFAARGCSVGLLARPSSDLTELSKTLTGSMALEADAGERQQVKAAIEAFTDEAGGLDVLVANAGVAYYAPVQELPVERVEQMVQINFLGTVYAIESGLPTMLAAKRGHIVVVSSVAGHRSFPSAAAYGASKAAQRAYIEAVRHDLAGTGIGVTGIYPGRVETNLHAHEQDNIPAWYQRGPTPLRAEEIAAAIFHAVETDRKSVFLPRIVRAMTALHGLSPALSDWALKVVMGRRAAAGQ